jgi:zinc/manganese transport system permease protein
VLNQLFEFHFMVNAFRAGTIVAVVAGSIGWFMVLRRQAFAGHTLAVVGFPGAAGAVLLGASATYGYYVFCIAAAIVIALLPRVGHAGGRAEESAVIGTVQAFALACGFLFLSLYGGNLGEVTNLLFGTFLGVTDGDVTTLLVLGLVSVLALALIARPLFFASVDPDVAAARGVRTVWLSTLFLVLMGVAVAEVSQMTGSLLVFALLVMPGAAAQQLTTRPAVSLACTIGFALAVTWLGLAVAYYSPYPIGFFVTTFGFAVYVLSALGRTLTERAGRRAGLLQAPAP